MKTFRNTTSSILIRFCLVSGALLGFSAGRSPAAPPKELDKLHVLLVVDTFSDLSDSVRIDGNRMEVLLAEGIPANRLRITKFYAEKVTPEEILRHYRHLKCGPNDGLLFYYAGHGAKDPNLGECFVLQHNAKKKKKGRVLARSEVRQAMQDKKAALTVLWTDCCTDPQQLIRPRPPGSKGIGDPAPGTARRIHPVLGHLLFQHRGLVDITAATENVALSDDTSGGVFTRTLADLLMSKVDQLDANRDGFVDWNEFFKRLQADTEKTSAPMAREVNRGLRRGEKPIPTTQRPRALTLPGGAPAAGPAFAVVSLKNNTRQKVEYQYRWSNAEDWKDGRLEPGATTFHARELKKTEENPPKVLFKFKGGTKEYPRNTARVVGRPSYAVGNKITIDPKPAGQNGSGGGKGLSGLDD